MARTMMDCFGKKAASCSGYNILGMERVEEAKRKLE